MSSSLTFKLIVSVTLTILGYSLFLSSFSFLLCKAVPVDLFNSAYDEIKRFPPQKSDSPGLCLENLGNDNITHFKWFRYHNSTNKCWHIDQRGPCSQNQIFYRVGDSDYGECDCNFYYRCARPLIYWAAEKRCYFTNDKGPCKDNEWLVVTEDGFGPTCEPNPCIHNQTLLPSRKDRYWFQKDGQCYMTLTRGYCSHPEELLYTKWDEQQPSCHIGRECNLRKVRRTESIGSRKSGVQQCLPGQKLDEAGRCRQLLRVSWWSLFAK